jgi:hypothetical protein
VQPPSLLPTASPCYRRPLVVSSLSGASAPRSLLPPFLCRRCCTGHAPASTSACATIVPTERSISEAPAAPRRHAHLCCRASVDRRLGPRLSTPVLAAPPPSTRPSGALCCRQRKLRPLVSCETSARDDFQPTWLTACTTSTRPFICAPPATPAPHAPLLYYRHNGGEDDAVQAGGAGRWRRGQDGPDHTGRPLIMP